ncbi:tetratricopeptide repeat protein [Nocardia yamanashiensis]|uniref:tetratricopeptide repeat protein n=1 Tax=Nocardia yamanashiensis TaxID=209247 RepID=UPI001E5A9D34|nr:tetratricopeptide repeat protein [Nocardia yamanashiensis]UGT43061.1 tetratricopeptide repeat protein [Nocardia yamanashiensis]
MDVQRVVGVSGALSGSGYLVGPRLVLTSAHVVGSDPPGVTVYRPGRQGEFAASVLWCGGPGGRVDAALVYVTATDWAQSTPDPVRWGRTVTYQPGIRCVTWGLPQFARRGDGGEELEQPTGTLNPGDGYVGDRYVVKLDGYPPDDGTDSPWRGISGAAVFCGDLLTGVVAADPEVRGHSALGAVPAYLLLNDAGFRAAVAAHAGGSVGLGCESIELQALTDRSSIATPIAVTPSSLLAPHRAVAAFRGRDQLLTQLHTWASEPGALVWAIHGRGGQGKTRLAQHLGHQLADQGWAVLWLAREADVAALSILARVTVSLLVIVDYAETRVEQLARLFETLAARSTTARVKVLVLARAMGNWWQETAAGSDRAADVVELAQLISLPPLDPAPQARLATYHAALQAFTDALAHLPGRHSEADWRSIATRTAARDHPDFGPDTTVLAVQMAALVALLNEVSPLSPAPVRSLEDRVLIHERRYWDASAAAHGLAALGSMTLHDIVAATVVMAPTTLTDLGRLLTRIPQLHDQPVLVRSRILDWLVALYPGHDGGDFGGLTPDRVAEQLIARAMLDETRPCVVEILAGDDSLTPAEAERLLTVCARAVAHPSATAAAPRLTQWCVERPDLLISAAIRIARRVEQPAPLLAAVTALAEDPATDIALLRRMNKGFPHHSNVLIDAALAVVTALVHRYRDRANTGAAEQNRLAHLLGILSIRLAQAGERDKSLAAAVESVELYRELAAYHPHTYRPAIGAAIHNLAVRLADLGHHERALRAAAEATDRFRFLATTDPDLYLPTVVSSLNNLAVDLGVLGRDEESLEAATESVELARQLVSDHPDGFDSALAMSLNTLAIRLSAMGHWQQGLIAAAESVDMYRGLAAEHPDVHLPNLADAISTHAILLREAGRRAEVLAADSEAASLRRQLVARHRKRFLADLATSVTNLALELNATGRRVEGHAAATEAVELYRELAADHPGVFRLDLARSINNLSIAHADAGRGQEALDTAYEAVAIYRDLTAAHPDRFLPELAATVDNLSTRLSQVGDHHDGLQTALEAVQIRRSLVAGDAHKHRPDLATSLNNLGTRLTELRRFDEALQATTEAVALYRDLAAGHPDRHLPNLAKCLSNLADRYRETGNHEQRVLAQKEATHVLRTLATADPAKSTPELASSVMRLAAALGTAGRWEQCLHEVTEAVGIYRQLDSSQPHTYRPKLDLAQELADYAREQVERRNDRAGAGANRRL